MQLNSLKFLLFFAVVFFIYYFPPGRSTKAKNVFLLLAGFVFYGMTDIKALILLIIIILIFYFLGRLCGRSQKAPALAVPAGVIFGVGVLLYFKYLNFFIDAFADILTLLGFTVHYAALKIMLPLGISFYIFRLISYLLDISNDDIKAEHNIVDFALYVSFFPALLSGPIDRAGLLMPQIKKRGGFDYKLAVDGLRQILFGLFKKSVIADNIAVIVDLTWDNIPQISGINLVLAAFMYSFEVYADFSGYSDIAIGVSKLLGFKITKNFNFPFFAKNISEYWRRWHISLSSWFRDYVFIPLNFSLRGWGKVGICLALVINFLLVGLWHGDNLTFLVFGLYQGLLFIPLVMSGSLAAPQNIKARSPAHARIRSAALITLNFILVSFGNIFFRAPSLRGAFAYIAGFKNDFFNIYAGKLLSAKYALFGTVLGLLIMIPCEWSARGREHGGDVKIKNTALRFGFYALLFFIILLLSGEKPFIYYKF